MQNTFSFLYPNLHSYTVYPKNIQLYVPPIFWRGDPVGHIGKYDAFFYVVSGECYVMVDGESFVVKEGELAFLPKGKMRAYANMSDSLTLYEINFEAEINGKNWSDELGFSAKNFPIKVRNPEEIQRKFESSVRYELNKEIFYDLIFCANLTDIIRDYVIGRFSLENSINIFSPVLDFMNNNLHRIIKIDELAELVFMQPTYFIRKFKAAFGESPIVYLNKLRIYRAMTLLATGDMTISEICHKVGIYDNSYFSKTFKSYCKITPGEYRETFTKAKKK